MTHLRIKRIELQGFRSYGPEKQVAEINAPIAVFWGPNSKGKTSFAEGIEFLLTGQTVKREILSSRQDEFADALRHAHLPADVETFVFATIECTGGAVHTIKRVLKKDYSKQKDCETALFIDGTPAGEAALGALGIVLSQPPLRAPVLAQHTLNYLFTTKPSDRAAYFKALLEVTDLDEFRSDVAGLEGTLTLPDDPLVQKLEKATAISAVSLHFLLVDLTDQAALEAAFESGAEALLQAELLPVPPTLAERVDALERLLAEKRSKTFPLELFSRKPFSAPAAPDDELWAKLERYVTEKAKIDEETRQLTALFRAALEIPAISEAESALDCALCGTPEALTPERITFIRDSVASTERYQAAETAARTALHDLQSKAAGFSDAVAAALPRFAKQSPGGRRKAGFTVARMRELLAETTDTVLPPWLDALRPLFRTRRVLSAQSAARNELLKAFIAAPADVEDVEPIKVAFARLSDAAQSFREAAQAYSAGAEPLHEALRGIIDDQSDTAGWQDFIDLARDLPGLRSATVASTVRQQAVAELKGALKEIDKGVEKVLDEKFETLSETIDDWWNRLRGSEPTFFSAVKRRGRNTIDFKGALSVHGDRANPKIRDVIAVFSDSQLHCLGLAVFLARAEHYGMSFVILDDPVLSSDEDYRAHFRTGVIGRLHELGIQVIVLTQHKNTRRDIGNANEHRGVDQFQIEILDPAKGSEITKTGDELSAMLASAEAYTTTDSVAIREEGGRKLRVATERFCKMLLVKKRLEAGDASAAISDYEGHMLGGKDGLVQQVLPYLTINPSHPGKLRTIRDDLNPPSHDDDDTPSQQALKEALGNLRRFQKDYLG